MLMPILSAQACGPDFFPDVFVHKLRPDHPKQFAQGKLGILLPTYPREDLIVAFRYLNSGTLSPSERAAYQPLYTENEPEVEQQWKSEDVARDKYAPPSQTWSVVSIKYAPTPAKIEQDRSITVKTSGGWAFQSQYLNCTDNAFATAISTLHSREKTWGEKSHELTDWVKAQNVVFSNCTAKDQALPAAVPPGSSALLKADRAYQIAAAGFYAGHFDDARKAFETIGQDATSPWRGIAQYLVARCLVRQAFFAKPNSDPAPVATFDPTLMKQAATVLRALLKEKPPGISVHAIQNELDLVRLRTEPNARVRELSTALSGPKTDPDYDQHLADLTWFLDANFDNKAVREDTSQEQFLTPDQLRSDTVLTAAQLSEQFRKTYIQFAQLRASAPLVDWLVTYQSPAREAAAHALDKWKTTHDVLWLVPAIAKASEKDADAPELIQAAEQVPVDSPARETLTYHRARLLIGLGRSQEARSVIDQVMPQLQASGRDSSVNAFRGLRMRAATDLNEFLAYAPQKILLKQSESQASLDECVEVTRNPKRQYDCKKEVSPTQFSADTASFFNTQASLKTLADVATSSELPDQLRRSVAMMAWVRAVLLKDDAAAARLFSLLPEKLQQQAGSGTGFRPVVAIVRNPGLRPFLDSGVQRSYSYDFVESYADNWWCPNFEGGSFSTTAAPLEKKPVSLLTQEQRSEGEQETARLMKQESASVYLGSQVLAYATDHPKDPDVPESLYLVLRMIRYDCNRWDATPAQKLEATKIEAIQRGVARLLRQRYAASPWTKKSAPFAG
jgi:hypothetical protein